MKMLTDKQVADKLSCSRFWVWKLRHKDPAFPAPYRLGASRNTRWAEEEIDAWLLTKKQIPTEDDSLETNEETNVTEN